LIGHRCKCSDVCSRVVLISRGLDGFLRFALCGFQRSDTFPLAIQPNTCRFFERVTMAAGIHLFPFRTEKLSPPALMVLRGRLRGRVGRRPFFLLGASRRAARFALTGSACQHFIISARFGPSALAFRFLAVPLWADDTQAKFSVCVGLVPVWGCLGVHFPCANFRVGILFE
jgi:hypothetical protein